MTTRTIRPYVGAVALALATLSPVVAPAQDVALVGIVRLDNSQDAGDVQVTGLIAGRPPEARSSLRDIYLYTVPFVPNVVLVFAHPGYESQALTVSLERGRLVSRVADIRLTSTNRTSFDAQTGDDGDDSHEESTQRRLRDHLASQAAIAERAGPVFLEIFRWNLAEYRHRFARNRVLLRELEAFSRESRYERIASPVRNPQVEVYGKIIEARATGRTSLEPRVALDVARDTRRPAPIRAAAVETMMNMSLPAESRIALLGILRESATTSRSPALLSSAFTGLAKLGTDEDRTRVTRAAQSADVDHVRAAITAISRTRIADGDSVTAAVIRSNPNPDVRAVVIEDLEHRIDTGAPVGPASTRATADALARDTAAVVRIRAVHILGAVSVSDSASRRALEAAAADTSKPDVSRTARRVLRRPP